MRYLFSNTQASFLYSKLYNGNMMHHVLHSLFDFIFTHSNSLIVNHCIQVIETISII